MTGVGSALALLPGSCVGGVETDNDWRSCMMLA